MDISERIEGNILVLSLNGRLDHAGATAFQALTMKKVTDGTRSIVADFGGTSFVASMGFRALMVPAQELSRVGGRFAIVGLSPEVNRLFDTAGLFHFFKVYPTVAEAATDGIWP